MLGYEADVFVCYNVSALAQTQVVNTGRHLNGRLEFAVQKSGKVIRDRWSGALGLVDRREVHVVVFVDCMRALQFEVCRDSIPDENIIT